MANTNLINTLKTLDPDLLFNDGGTTWRVDNLIDVLHEAEADGSADPNNPEYVCEYTSDGRITLTALDEDGNRITPPAYVQHLAGVPE